MLAEQELVGRILAGNADAEREFYEMYRPRLLRASRYFLGGQDSDAEDVVQEAFIIAFRKLGDYVFRAPIYAWLRQICLRLCYARLRTRKRFLLSMEEDIDLFMQGQAVERVRRGDEEALKKRRLEMLGALTQKLSPDSLQIIEMRDVQGMRYAAISVALNIPMGTVMSRLSRAREQLKKLVETSVNAGAEEPASAGWESLNASTLA